MTDFTPHITTEDLRLALNGIYSGSTNEYWYWGQNISSGSVLAQINLANYFMFGVLGDSLMNSSNEITSYHVRTCLLDYSCMRLLTLLSGDIITDGFNFTAGVTVQQPALLPTFRMLIEQFKESAKLHLRIVQPIQVSMDSDQPVYRDTAPSMF